MTDLPHDSLRERQLREQLAAMPGLPGIGDAHPVEATTGLPQWEARTRDQRFAEKVRTHGYPLGLAKGTFAQRDRLLAAHHQRVGNATAEQRAVYDAVHEALAWALDAERFLGSFAGREGGGLPPETVDAVTDHLLVWLRERGCTVVPIAPIPAPGAAPAELTLSSDLASGMLLDPPAHATYERILRNDLPFETPAVDGVTNAGAAAWANALALSTALPGELPPPAGPRASSGGMAACWSKRPLAVVVPPTMSAASSTSQRRRRRSSRSWWARARSR
jgi:hypothetical protein